MSLIHVDEVKTDFKRSNYISLSESFEKVFPNDHRENSRKGLTLDLNR